MSVTEDAYTLPPMYSVWVNEFLQAPLPAETEATCQDCVMCKTKNIERTHSDPVFNLKTKCCTYIPKIPNFLVGKILSDADPACEKGRRAFEDYFRAGAVIRPQGVFPPFDFWVRYSSSEVFGRNESLRCPYYLEEEGGLCGIRNHRTSRCATWFCKHVRGSVGRAFWMALDELLSSVEVRLSNWCAHQLEAGTEEYRKWYPWSEKPGASARLLQEMHYYRSSMISRLAETAAYKEFQEQIWGKWLGREREFFQECLNLVKPLHWEQVLTIGGPDISSLAVRTKEALTAISSNQVPQRLEPGEIRSAKLSDGKTRVWGYGAYDAIDLPKSILELLPYFDGHSTQEVLNTILGEKGVNLSRDWLRKLTDFGVLVAPK